MSGNWSSCYPAENACPPYCHLLTCDVIYGVLGGRDNNETMYDTIRTIDACRWCDKNAACSGWDNITRSSTSDAASSLRYSVDHCGIDSCNLVHVDACRRYVRSVVLVTIIAFLATSLLGYLAIQTYVLCRGRSVNSTVYSSGTGIDAEHEEKEIDDEEECNNHGLVITPVHTPKDPNGLPTVQENAVV